MLHSGQISLTCCGRQELDLDADGLGDAGVLAVLVHAVAVAGEADVGDLVETTLWPVSASSVLYSATE